MSGFAFKYLLGGIAVGVVCSGAAPAQNANPPDFSGDNTGWVSIGTDYVAVPGSPKPVTFDPAHRYVPNGSGEQPTFRVADLNNPVLTQFAKDGLKTANDMVLRGFAMYARERSRSPAGSQEALQASRSADRSAAIKRRRAAACSSSTKRSRN